jgi:hypothetical protein
MNNIPQSQYESHVRNMAAALTPVLMSSMSSQGASASRGPGGSRDPGPDLSGTAAPVSGPSTTAADQDAQRFFGSILSTIGSVIVPKLATGIIGMLQQKRRELGLPEQRDAASMERDLQSVLSSLLPALVQAVPMIASSLSGQPAPRSPEEESQRFLPFLAAVVPALISAAPKIISAFNRQRGVESAEPSISSPEVADRFIGPLLQTLVPQLLQSAPSILGSIFRGGHRRVDNGQKP